MLANLQGELRAGSTINCPHAARMDKLLTTLARVRNE